MRCIRIKSVAWMVSCLVVIGLVGSACWAADPTSKDRLKASFAHSGGIYGGGCFDGVFGIFFDRLWRIKLGGLYF